MSERGIPDDVVDAAFKARDEGFAVLCLTCLRGHDEDACPHCRSEGEPPDDDRIYPCAKCGKMRTKAEGGTVFTVCEECWNTGPSEPPAALPVEERGDDVSEIAVCRECEGRGFNPCSRCWPDFPANNPTEAYVRSRIEQADKWRDRYAAMALKHDAAVRAPQQAEEERDRLRDLVVSETNRAEAADSDAARYREALEAAPRFRDSAELLGKIEALIIEETGNGEFAAYVAKWLSKDGARAALSPEDGEPA